LIELTGSAIGAGSCAVLRLAECSDEARLRAIEPVTLNVEVVEEKPKGAIKRSFQGPRQAHVSSPAQSPQSSGACRRSAERLSGRARSSARQNCAPDG